MLRNCIYHLCDDAVPLFHVRKRRFPIQLPGLSKNHESERNQLMKKSNRKKFLQFVVLVLFLAALFVPQDANRLLIAGIALIGIGVTLFSYLLPLFTERLKNREHKLRKRPERTRHLEGTPDLETILWRQIKFQITGKLKEAFPDATWDFVKEPPLSQILDGEPLRIRTRNTGSYNFAEILMDARGSLTLQMMTIESLHKNPISVRDSDSIEEVTETIEKYDLVALPVVDSIGRLVGRITIDDVMDEVREQHERDYQLASGISQDVETSDNVFTQTAARLPWLLIGMIGGLGNSVILGGFESSFATNPKMALFIPLIGGTGGNVGIQSSAIVVQGLANNTLKEGNIVPQILKESVVSLINASIISLVVFIYNFFMLGDRGITASVSLSLFAVVMFASIFGTLVPMTLDKMKIDPALATGPFITITNDIIGMMIYMFITSALA